MVDGARTRIRPARPADAGAIARVHVDSWRTTYPGLVPDTYLVGLDADSSAGRWRTVLAGRRFGGGTVVADHADYGIVGFGTCGRQRTQLAEFGGEFYALYLRDVAQGQGLGRRMLTAMAASLVDLGMDAAVVWVLRNNPARWFYERLGGVCLAERPIRFAGSRLIESAYGWRDLAHLARLSVDPEVGY
ncbi:MAG: GNAT family N-acetyltransferase [Azospirillum sp.]|nr:GNAT family N-acetyltransferase [Azospirillum sp.]